MLRHASPGVRKVIYCVGGLPTNEFATAMGELGFVVDSTSSTVRLDDDEFVGSLVAAIITQPAAGATSSIDVLTEYARRLLDHDCLIYMISSDTGWLSVCKSLEREGIPYVQPVGTECDWLSSWRAKVTELPWPNVTVHKMKPTAGQFAQLLFTNGASRAPVPDVPAAFKVTGPSAERLTAAQRMMLRRGFFDCGEIFLAKLTDGNSGGKVFLAYTRSEKPEATRPRPFFVKIGPRHKLFQEWSNYQDYVRNQVPFYLRPDFIAERCAVGAEDAILVGNFIEESESLGECAREGRAITPIGNLFDKTLQGWHSNAYESKEKLSVSRGYLLEGAIPPRRLAAVKALGLVSTVADLTKRLGGRPEEQMLWGQIHGDLHIENVRVRSSDAILIDFASTVKGPVLDDAAALEVSLAIRGPSNERFDMAAWAGLLDSLYSKEALLVCPRMCDAKEQYAWLFGCIRQIRLRALPMQRAAFQYAACLAYRYYQAATKDLQARRMEEQRRVRALVLAERLLS